MPGRRRLPVLPGRSRCTVSAPLAGECARCLDELTDDAIDVLVERFPRRQSPLSMAMVFVLDGAYAAVGADATAAIEAEAARLADWLGPVRVTPRFRTPLERELVA